jgi:hypothetical protein
MHTQILNTEKKTIAITHIHKYLPWKPNQENQQPVLEMHTLILIYLFIVYNIYIYIYIYIYDLVHPKNPNTLTLD